MFLACTSFSIGSSVYQLVKNHTELIDMEQEFNLLLTNVQRVFSWTMGAMVADDANVPYIQN